MTLYFVEYDNNYTKFKSKLKALKSRIKIMAYRLTGVEPILTLIGKREDIEKVLDRFKDSVITESDPTGNEMMCSFLFHKSYKFLKNKDNANIVDYTFKASYSDEYGSYRGNLEGLALSFWQFTIEKFHEISLEISIYSKAHWCNTVTGDSCVLTLNYTPKDGWYEHEEYKLFGDEDE